MKKTLHQLSVLAVLGIPVLLSGCASVQPIATKQTFSFDYKIPSTEQPGSAGMVVALIRPDYGENFLYTHSEIFKRLKTSMADDVEELIIDKGFRIKSEEPFESMDDMIFEDKKTTDILIKIEMNPEFTASNGKWKTNITYPVSFSYAGTVSLIGKINLVGIEPLSGQKIWSKSVSIPEIQQIPIKTELRYDSVDQSIQTLINDPGIYNAVGAAYSQQYKSIMNRVAAHFNPEEFKSLKGQIKELKSKKGF